MLDRLFGYKVHHFLHILGMSLFAFGLPLNKVLMSIGAIWGVSNLVLEGDFRSYWTRIKKNKIFHWLFAFFSIHILALFWSTDTSYALHDLLIKLPLLSVPLAFVARPTLSRKNVHLILYALLISLLFTSLLNIGFYKQWFGHKEYSDIRQLSLFGSHIRYGILIALGAAICLYFIRETNSKLSKLLWFLLFGWFSMYTFYSQILSGAIALVVIIFMYILLRIHSYSKRISLVFATISLGIIFSSFYFLFQGEKNVIDVHSLPKKTVEGNDYVNCLNDKSTENNNRIYVSICELELKREWEKISAIPFDKKDKANHPLKYTLIRYLTSKNISKDALGMGKLTKIDIQNIENGIASVNLLKTGMIARLYEIRHQINNHTNPNGNSLLQRIEYWKTGWHIIQSNWLMGVGTGDVQIAFDQQYEKEKSILLSKNRHRAHNMYLTVFISFGFVGLILFLGVLYTYFKENLANKELIPVLFISAVICTFMIEDTIETQMGVCLISLFLGLFMSKIEPSSTTSLNATASTNQ